MSPVSFSFLPSDIFDRILIPARVKVSHSNFSILSWRPPPLSFSAPHYLSQKFILQNHTQAHQLITQNHLIFTLCCSYSCLIPHPIPAAAAAAAAVHHIKNHYVDRLMVPFFFFFFGKYESINQPTNQAKIQASSRDLAIHRCESLNLGTLCISLRICPSLLPLPFPSLPFPSSPTEMVLTIPLIPSHSILSNHSRANHPTNQPSTYLKKMWNFEK